MRFIYDYGDSALCSKTRGLGVDDSADDEINKLIGYSKGNKVGVIFYGSEGYLVQESYGHCIAYDKEFKIMKEFNGGAPHFKNFMMSVTIEDVTKLNASMTEGHLSAGISHLGNISYYLGEKNHVTTDELRSAISKVKSLDDNVATLERTIKHFAGLTKVGLEKYPLSLGRC